MKVLYLALSIYLMFCVVDGANKNGIPSIADVQTYLNNLFHMKLPSLNKNSNNGGDSSKETNVDKCSALIEKPTRPCPKNDVTCVSAYFQAHSSCRPFDSNDDSKLQLGKNRFYLPFFNVIIELNMTISGLDAGQIVDFIVDDSTDLVVLTVSYKDISVVLHRADYIYFESEKEPKLFATSPTIYFSSFLITSTFAGSKNPQLSNSFHVGNLTSLPEYTINVCSQYTEDPAINSLLTRFDTNKSAAALEAFLTLARPFQSKYIRSKLCNFDVFDINV